MADAVPLTESCDVNLLEAIGRGAVGVVHLGRHEIAIKRVYYKDENKKNDKKIKEVAMQEVANFKKMKYHPNIVQYYNYRDDGSSIWIMMEYCDQGNLDSFLKEQSVSTLFRIQIMKQICEGVKYLHALGIYHGDLKPGNILVKKDGEEYVFKLSDISGVEIKGTYQYMAPELQTDSETPDMFKADLFSLGLLFKDIIEGGISKTEKKPYSQIPFAKQLLAAFQQGQESPKLTLDGDISDEIKEQLQKLINAMTVLDTTERLSLSDVYHKLDAIEMSLIHNKGKQADFDIKYAIRCNFTTLVHHLKPKVMLIHCFSQSIISVDELEQLRRASDYLGLFYQSEMLLNIILGKGESDIWGFLQILKKTQPDLYQLLNPSMSKEEYESSSLGDSLHDVIQQNYTDFCERIVAMEITPILFQENLLTVQEFVALTQGRDRHGLNHQRKMLIDTLLKKNPSQLKKFVNILKSKQPSLYFSFDSLKDLRAHFTDLRHCLIGVYTANKCNIVTDLPGENWKLDVTDKTQLIPVEFAVQKRILVTNVKHKAADYKYTLNFDSIEEIICALSKESERLLLITGNPGCGKTVFVHTLVSQWMQQSDPMLKVYEAMFLIPVRNIDIEASLLEILSSSRKGLSYIKDSFKQGIDALLCNRDTGRQILLVLDGIDEVQNIPSNCELYRLLNGQKYPFVRILVTSRFEARILNSILPDYKVEISGITEHSFNEYLNNKVGRPGTEWEHDQLRQFDFHLTETPFYLNIAAFLLKKYSSQDISHRHYVLPNSSTQLFNVFIAFLLRIWLQRLGRLQDAKVLALDRNVLDRESKVPIDIKSKLLSFGYVGYSFLKKKKYIFTQEDLFEMLIDISDIEQSGLFCISSGVMRFRHKHLQEFLAALYLTRTDELKNILVIRLFEAMSQQGKAILSTIFQDVHSIMPFVFGLSPVLAMSILDLVAPYCCVGSNNNAIDIGYEAKLCFESQNEKVDEAMINILLNCENEQTNVFHYFSSVSNVYRLCDRFTTAQAQAVLHKWYGLEVESNDGHWIIKNSSFFPQNHIICKHSYLHIKTLNDCLFFILSKFSFPQVESLKIECSSITDIKRITQCFPHLQKLDLNDGKPHVDRFLENKCMTPFPVKESSVTDLTLRCFDDPLPNTSLMNLFKEQNLQLLKLKWVNILFADLNKLIEGPIWPKLEDLEICLWKIEDGNMESVYNNLEVLGQSLTQLQSLTFGCNLNNTSTENKSKKDIEKKKAYQEQFFHSIQVRFQGLSVLRLHRVLFPDDINTLCRCLKHMTSLQKLGLCWRDVEEKEEVLLKELEKIEHVNTLEIIHGSPDIERATLTKESFEKYCSYMAQCKTTISLWKWTLAVGIEEIQEIYEDAEKT